LIRNTIHLKLDIAMEIVVRTELTVDEKGYSVFDASDVSKHLQETVKERLLNKNYRGYYFTEIIKMQRRSDVYQSRYHIGPAAHHFHVVLDAKVMWVSPGMILHRCKITKITSNSNVFSILGVSSPPTSVRITMNNLKIVPMIEHASKQIQAIQAGLQVGDEVPLIVYKKINKPNTSAVVASTIPLVSLRETPVVIELRGPPEVPAGELDNLSILKEQYHVALEKFKAMQKAKSPPPAFNFFLKLFKLDLLDSQSGVPAKDFIPKSGTRVLLRSVDISQVDLIFVVKDPPTVIHDTYRGLIWIYERKLIQLGNFLGFMDYKEDDIKRLSFIWNNYRETTAVAK
jgi:hypothetical protein